jgi:hypothetical protein
LAITAKSACEYNYIIRSQLYRLQAIFKKTARLQLVEKLGKKENYANLNMPSFCHTTSALIVLKIAGRTAQIKRHRFF